MQFKHLIDDIVIDFLSTLKFARIMDIKRKCNVNLSKFASSEKIYNGVILFKVTSCITFFFFWGEKRNV